MRSVHRLLVLIAFAVAIVLGPGCPSTTPDNGNGNSDDTASQCTPGVVECSTDSKCDDGDPCTTDTCDDGCCKNTTPGCITAADCDDDNACTTDACDGGCCLNPPDRRVGQVVMTPMRLTSCQRARRCDTRSHPGIVHLASASILMFVCNALGQPPVGNVGSITAADKVDTLRTEVTDGRFGRMEIDKVVNAILSSQGQVLQENYLTLAVRKAEALPHVLRKLQDGNPYEKRMMTKVLRYLGWAEALPTLISVIQSDTEHPLARIGSTYALGAIGDQSAGPALLVVLAHPAGRLSPGCGTVATIPRADRSQ